MLQNARYMLLDAARMGSFIKEAMERNKSFESLYRGTSSERLADVAPYIFQFSWNSTFANWVLNSGWGKSWGVLLKSSYPMQELHKHFRKFLKVQTEAGQSLYFRFYDPRVLKIFLPTCDSTQLREFFGPIDYFIMESNDPGVAIRFWHENGFLKSDQQQVADLIAELPVPAPLPQKAEELPPETIAILEQLKVEYPDIDFPGLESKPAETTAKAEPQPEPKQSPPPAKRGFSPLGDDEDQPQPTASTQKTAPAKPSFSPLGDEEAPKAEKPQENTGKPKSKWNMFD